MEEEAIPVLILLAAIVLVAIVLILFFATIFTFFEFVYGRLFYKPFFVHWYRSLKTLPNKKFEILFNEVPYYRKLRPRKRSYFEHRVASFIERYEFIGKEGFEVDERAKVLIAATYVQLTFGMRLYLYPVFDKVIVFPSIYYSNISEAYHKGEFNPMLKAVVFSWEDFQQGLHYNNDNLNLGLHEFAHVLNFQGLRSEDASSLIFARFFNQIRMECNHGPNREKLMNSGYFREYAYTNDFEFIAVVLEHFFETPKEFKTEFPELYYLVKRMINYKEAA
ncbi:zinc-dependent peptidase [Flavobacterium sp.]|uniref:zinc-dependent peptidase n=1 Tax=Flavobacterium sp. TaxID=239 RepID=UPI0028BEC12A|nr:zinc-dependent peptidase [Flavobacterium sp.]